MYNAVGVSRQIRARGPNNGGFAICNNDGQMFSREPENFNTAVSNLSTHCRDPLTIRSRIRVSNLAKGRVTRVDIYKKFYRYGVITAISNLTSKPGMDAYDFAFVQFTNPLDAERAVITENGANYFGRSIEVKLAEFRNDHQADSKPINSQGNHADIAINQLINKNPPPVTGMKRSTDSYVFPPPSEKKIKTELVEQNEEIPDILVCGMCHKTLPSIEAMIYHKRTPCMAHLKCKCAEDNVPAVITCAICFKDCGTPWQLIQHIQKAHGMDICSNIRGGKNGDGECYSSPELNAGGESVLDLDNDLLEEDELLH